MSSSQDSIADRLAILAAAIAMLAFALFFLAIAGWVGVKVWSSVDCTFDPQSKRCVYLEERDRRSVGSFL